MSEKTISDYNSELNHIDDILKSLKPYEWFHEHHIIQMILIVSIIMIVSVLMYVVPYYLYKMFNGYIAVIVLFLLLIMFVSSPIYIKNTFNMDAFFNYEQYKDELIDEKHDIIEHKKDLIRQKELDKQSTNKGIIESITINKNDTVNVKTNNKTYRVVSESQYDLFSDDIINDINVGDHIKYKAINDKIRIDKINKE